MKKLVLLSALILSFSAANAQDLIVTSLQNPSDACQLTASESITVTIWNSSISIPHAGAFDVSYELNNGPTVTVTNNTNINGNAIYTFTFPVPDDFSNCQSHDLKVWVTGGIDPNHANDTLWASVISDCPAIPGTITGNSPICENINDDSLHLSGQNGTILAWDNSTDGASTWNTTWTPDDFYHYVNLPSASIWRVIVDSPFGICGPDTSAWFTLDADTESDAGTLPADFDICDNGNGGDIWVTGQNGNITNWLLSTNFGAGWIPLGQTNDTITYNNLQNTTQYVVIVKNGVCPADTSSMINLSLIQGTVPGTIDGPLVVCNQDNADQLEATGGNGDVIEWWVSTDSINWQPTLVANDSIFPFSGLGNQTHFQAVWQFGNCPTESAFFTVTTLPVVTYVTSDTTIDEGESINLEIQGGNSWTWWPDQFMDDPNSDTPIVNPDSDITYFCEVVSVEGCKDTVRIVVTVNPDLTTLQIPNLITPNGDGFNDVWEIGNIQSFPETEVVIFNIYGQVVYEANQGYNNDWAGTNDKGGGAALPDGTYFYQVNLNIPEDDPAYIEPIQGVVTIAGNEGN